MQDVQAPQPSSVALVPKRVLVAEDSSVTQDLLKLVLSQRGHAVDIAHDGEQALARLRAGSYDVALLDFHLPKMNGVRVAAACRDGAIGSKLPRFVAITADVEGLLEDGENCESFDAIVPKPLNIRDVARLIEAEPTVRDNHTNAVPRQRSAGKQKTAEVPRNGSGETARTVPDPPNASLLDSLGLELLNWPADFDGARLSPRVVQASLGDARFDAIVVRAPSSGGQISAIWQHKALHLLPIIDLTGSMRAGADLDASRLATGEISTIHKLIEDFHSRRAQLHHDFILTDDLSERLLGRVFVSGKTLSAGYDASSPDFTAYNCIMSTMPLVREADSLVARGLFVREFFDRFHICERCGSSRLSAREECPSCRSSNVREEAYLHHFSCAYQGVEADFKSGARLICPKCRKQLSHFGFDYDKPGTLLNCGGCGHSTSEPVVGFICADCGTHGDATASRTRDAFSYKLTAEGLAFAEAGQAFLGQAQQAMRFADLPLELIVALNVEAKTYNESRTPFALVEIVYRNERDVVREHGARLFAQTRHLFLETLSNALPQGTRAFQGRGCDFALVKGASTERAAADLGRVTREAQKNIRLVLGIAIKAFGPEDFA